MQPEHVLVLSLSTLFAVTPAHTQEPPLKRLVDSPAAAALVTDNDPTIGSKLLPAPQKALGCTGPGSIVYDDGGFEDGYVPGSTISLYGGMVQRFDPIGPVTSLDTFCVCFTRLSFDSSIDFDIVVWDDDGIDGGPGTEIARLPAVMNDIPTFPDSRFATYDLSSAGVVPPSGRFYAGVGSWQTLFETDIFLCADTSSSTPVRPAYVTNNETAPHLWNNIAELTSDHRALGIRVEAPAGPPTDGNCIPSETTLCLNQGRFKVEVDWQTADSNGPGVVVPGGTGDSSNLYFFSPNNWEMLVKVLDGCAINDRYWVFFAATTDVGFTVTVTDTASEEIAQYFNPLGQAANAVTDTAAFATCQ